MKATEKDLLKVNLQLFAEDPEDEEIEDGGYAGKDEPEEETEETEETENTDEDSTETKEEPEEPEEKPVPKMDKKDHAIVKAKQETKALKAELAKYKQAEEERKLAEQKEKTKKKFIDNGYSEEEAAEKAEEKTKISLLEKKIKDIEYRAQAEKLSQRFPDIYDNLNSLVDICEKTGWSLEKVAKAELDESTDYDIKTKTEQEALLRRQKAAEKKVDPGSTKTEKTVKLSQRDEKTYQNMLKFPQYKGLTRKRYLEIINEDE